MPFGAWFWCFSMNLHQNFHRSCQTLGLRQGNQHPCGSRSFGFNLGTQILMKNIKMMPFWTWFWCFFQSKCACSKIGDQHLSGPEVHRLRGWRHEHRILGVPCWGANLFFFSIPHVAVEMYYAWIMGHFMTHTFYTACDFDKNTAGARTSRRYFRSWPGTNRILICASTNYALEVETRCMKKFLRQKSVKSNSWRS